MKKFIVLLLCIVVLSNCEISPRRVEAQDCYTSAHISDNSCSNISYHEIDDMKFAIIHTYYGGTESINLTKDSLECEYYRLQLELLSSKTKPTTYE